MSNIITFFTACEKGMASDVISILDKKTLLFFPAVNINKKREDGYTPLIVAADNSHTEVVNLLLDNGALVDMQDNKGESALFKAVYKNDKPIVETLFKHGADVNLRDKEDSTALIKAAAEANCLIEVINVLFDNGAIVDAENKYGKTALLVSAENRHCHLPNIETLLKRGAYVNAREYDGIGKYQIDNGEPVYDKEKHGFSALSHLCSVMKCKEAHTQAVEILLEYGADVEMTNDIGDTPLRSTNCPEIIEILIKHRADIDKQDFLGDTALIKASRLRNVEVLKKLLEKEANINITNNAGETALDAASGKEKEKIIQMAINGFTSYDYNEEPTFMNAIFNGDVAQINALISNNADVNCIDEGFNSALMNACAINQLNVAKILLESGALINATGESGRTALMYAAGNGHVDIVKWLIDAGVEVSMIDKSGNTALWWTLDRNTEYATEIAEILIENGLYLWQPANNSTDLMFYAGNGHEEMVKHILETEQNINAQNDDGQTALSYAIEWGYSTIVEQLIAAGADVNNAQQQRQGKSELWRAIKNNHKDIIEMLRKAHAQTVPEALVEEAEWASKNVLRSHTDNVTLLMRAAENGHENTVAYLIDAGAEINFKNVHGNTALSYASNGNYLSIVSMLIAAGADIENDEALVVAARSGHHEMVNLLLESGVQINFVDKWLGQSALWAACFSNRIEITKTLLLAGANTNIRSKWGHTTVTMLAAESNKPYLLKLFLNADTDVNLQNEKGKTAFTLAKENHHYFIQKMLLDAGAEDMQEVNG